MKLQFSDWNWQLIVGNLDVLLSWDFSVYGGPHELPLQVLLLPVTPDMGSYGTACYGDDDDGYDNFYGAITRVPWQRQHYYCYTIYSYYSVTCYLNTSRLLQFNSYDPTKGFVPVPIHPTLCSLRHSQQVPINRVEPINIHIGLLYKLCLLILFVFNNQNGCNS